MSSVWVFFLQSGHLGVLSSQRLMQSGWNMCPHFTEQISAIINSWHMEQIKSLTTTCLGSMLAGGSMNINRE
jgi:hypothetical protein